MIRLLIAVSLCSLALLYACGPTSDPLKCKPETCKGCCTNEDTCVEGTTKALCGVSGVGCTKCEETDYCRNGNCTSDPGCKSLNQSCTLSSECCTGYSCFSGKCSGGNSCTNAGGSCTFPADCCSNNCVNNTCEAGAGCNPQGGLCSPCCQVGLVCVAGYCQPGSGGGAGGGSGGGGGGCIAHNGPCGPGGTCCQPYTCTQNTCR